MFHESGGCCDGSSPMCYPLGEFMTGPSDVLLGYLDVEGGTDEAGGLEAAKAGSRILTEEEMAGLGMT